MIFSFFYFIKKKFEKGVSQKKKAQTKSDYRLGNYGK